MSESVLNVNMTDHFQEKVSQITNEKLSFVLHAIRRFKCKLKPSKNLKSDFIMFEPHYN